MIYFSGQLTVDIFMQIAVCTNLDLPLLFELIEVTSLVNQHMTAIE